MIIRLLPILALAALLVGGCSKSPSETSKDVAKAREKASQDVTAAQKDASKTESKTDLKVAEAEMDYSKTEDGAHDKLNQVESEAMAKMAAAEFDVAMAEAKGRHNIETKKCGVLKDVEKTACLSAADATLAAEKATATANRDAHLVAADHHE